MAGRMHARRWVGWAWRIHRLGPYLLSHHPHCAAFGADVLWIRGRRHCIACHVGLPALAVAWSLSWWLLPAHGPTLIGALAAGAVLFMPQVASHLGRFRRRSWQVGVKLLMGSGIGLGAGAVSAAPLPIGHRIGILVAGYVALQALWLLRLRRIDRTCAGCMDRARRPHCLGLAELQARMRGA